MKFIAISTLLFFILSCVFGFKKNGERKVLIMFVILEIACLFEYGLFTVSFFFSLAWNFIVLMGIINGVIKGKGEMYLAEKYDDRHEND